MVFKLLCDIGSQAVNSQMLVKDQFKYGFSIYFPHTNDRRNVSLLNYIIIVN